MLESLYELSGDASEALASLVERYGNEDALLEAVEELLADVGLQPAVIENIRGAYEHPDSDQYPLIRGPLGLCLFLDRATTASLFDEPPEDVLDEAKGLVGDQMIKTSLRALYKLDDSEDLKRCDLSSAKLYKVGTTSMIIDCKHGTAPSERAVLKCVLPRHFLVRAITEGAKYYGRRDGAMLSLAPKVYGSNDRAVLMELIPGETLAERLAKDQVPEQQNDPTGEKRAKLRALRRMDIEFIRELGRMLCETLMELSTSEQSHLDLSPRNIILTRNPTEVRLIDFGRNFAIAEGVASSLALARSSVYVEPQMITHQRAGDWRSDCYSFGIILLEAAARAPLYRGTIAAELWRLWTGEHSWDGAPGLARVIEDLIDADPQQRLVFMAADGDRERRDNRLASVVQR